jgi:hypothetical protein
MALRIMIMASVSTATVAAHQAEKIKRSGFMVRTCGKYTSFTVCFQLKNTLTAVYARFEAEIGK